MGEECGSGVVWVINDADGEVKGVGDLGGSRLCQYISEMRGLECL